MSKIFRQQNSISECHDFVISTSISNSVGPGFKSHHDPLIVVFLNPAYKFRSSAYTKATRLLLLSIQLIIH
jgi:hypothetical protein